MDQAKYKEYLKRKYFDEGASFADIASEIKTYSNKIRRDFIKFGFTPRDKSSAQANALFYGKQVHPTKGKHRTEDEKLRISENVAKSWENMSDEDKDSRAKKAKKQWDKKTVRQMQDFRHKAAVAMRKAADDGSKMEKLVCEYFLEAGHPPLFHQEIKLFGKTLEVDILIPSLNLAVEIDGPSHFLPIWGEDKLLKKISSDSEKNGILLEQGYSVLRFKHIVKKISQKYKRDAKKLIEDNIKVWENNKTVAKVYLLEVV